MLVICYGVLAGCATVTRTPSHATVFGSADADKVASQDSGLQKPPRGWWRVGFYRAYGEEDTVLWHLDALLANDVLKPLIDQYGHDLPLWRFHRRAAVDPSGHKFSFIFYSSRDTAVSIFQAIEHNRQVTDLLDHRYLERLSFTDTHDELVSDVGAASDPAWSIELQKAWPQFSMGVSRTWLELIGQFAGQSEIANGADGVSMDSAARIAWYKKINTRVNAVWEQEGGHAFLHHLNALFGYQELYITERHKTRF